MSPEAVFVKAVVSSMVILAGALGGALTESAARAQESLTARGESPTAFGRRCIASGCVAPPSNIPDILGRRALPAGVPSAAAALGWSTGRIAALGATPDFHHGQSKTVADGVYTDSQAVRGAAVYESACSGCHRADLGGATGPSLREQRFARNFAGQDLKTLFTRIATTMPRNAPASLGDNVYLDVVAHVLKENGFPAGPHELTADALDGIRVVAGTARPLPPIGDFSYVEVVGCLTAGPQNTWLLTLASEPVVAVPAAGAPSTAAAAAKPRGTQTFRLLDAMAYAPDDHQGHTMYVRGLLIRLPGEQRMTISSFEMVSATCGD